MSASLKSERNSWDTDAVPARVRPKPSIDGRQVMPNHLQRRNAPPVDPGRAWVDIPRRKPIPRAPVVNTLAVAEQLRQRDSRAINSHPTHRHELAHGKNLARPPGGRSAPVIQQVDQKIGNNGNEIQLRRRKDARVRIPHRGAKGLAQHDYEHYLGMGGCRWRERIVQQNAAHESAAKWQHLPDTMR